MKPNRPSPFDAVPEGSARLAPHAAANPEIERPAHEPPMVEPPSLAPPDAEPAAATAHESAAQNIDIDAPKNERQRPTLWVPEELVREFVHEWHRNEARMRNLRASRLKAEMTIRRQYKIERDENGDYFAVKIVHPLDRFLAPYRAHDRAHAAPRAAERHEEGAANAQSAIAVAEARKRWDEAKQSGDPDRMTRAANDLLRVVEADRAARGEPAPAVTGGGRHPTSEILAPDEGRQKEQTITPGATRLGVETASAPRRAPVDSWIGHSVIDPSYAHAQTDDPAVPSNTPVEEYEREVEREERQPMTDETQGRVEPLARVNERGELADVKIETPGMEQWGTTNRAAARMILERIARIGRAIEQFGTADQKKAWAKIKKMILQDAGLATDGVAQNDNDVLMIDLARLAPGGDPRKTPDDAFILFALAHEIFHSGDLDRAAQQAAIKMQGGRHDRSHEIGSPQWSAEVRHDKMVYDFCVRAGLINPASAPIERIAPYYAEHLKNPNISVLPLPVPGYDKPFA